MSRVVDEGNALIDAVTDALGDSASVVTMDVQGARPMPGKVAVFIEPPDIDYPTWGDRPVTTWRLDLIAGTMTTQGEAFALIMAAIGRLAAHDINIQQARPATMSLAQAGSVAAYQVTLNPLELIQEE